MAKPVAVVDDRIRKLVADMAETMYAAPGVGLAATQVDVHERVIVIDVSDAHDELQVFINPEIVWSSDDKKVVRRGLPVGARHLRLRRAAGTSARDARSTRRAKPFEIDCEGLLAVCIQHEMDHLMGKVFVEYLSPLKQNAHQGQDEEARGRAVSALSDCPACSCLIDDPIAACRFCRNAGICRRGARGHPRSRIRACRSC